MPIDPKMRISALEALQDAFHGLSPPGDGQLLHPDCRDDNDIADFYGAPDQATLADDLIIANYAAPSFFSARAFQYYMPAFMRWSLNNPDSVEMACESTLRAFDPGRVNEPLYAFQVSKYALFTSAQRQAIGMVLQAFLEDPYLGPIALNALPHHWDEKRSEDNPRP